MSDPLPNRRGIFVNRTGRRTPMSFVLQKQQRNVLNAVDAYQAEIAEIEGHLRLRAMANDVSDRELDLLRRLKDEKSQMLYRYENLREAFKALLDDSAIAAE
jgi:hypothetical protein